MNRVIKLNPFTKAAVEMALWDIAGKVAGVPVSIIRGYDYIPMEDASIQRILRGSEKDLFR